MPNHFHGIIIGAGLVPAREVTAMANFYGRVQDPPQNPHLSQIVGAFKSITTHQYILGVYRWPRTKDRLKKYQVEKSSELQNVFHSFTSFLTKS